VLITAITVLIIGALNYHIIRTDRGFRILKKANISILYTCVDARGAKILKLYLNPALVRSGIESLNPFE